MIYITHIDNDTVDKINSTLNSLVIEEETGDRATRGGFQSVNIRHGFDYRILTRFLPFDFAYRTDWIHYIEYDVGGFQKRHKHEKHEKFSWVLYLNDSDGDTLFYTEGSIRVSPRKGKLVVFSSDIEHEAMTTMMGKKVLVGGIDKID